jgi:diguanylate cyclase (GGDEF)-like protein
MNMILSHLVVAALCGAIGWLAGWRLQWGWSRPTPADGLNDPTLIKNLLSSLHCLSLRVAADVGEHTTRIGEVDRQLASATALPPASVHTLVNRLLKANQDVQSKLNQAEGKLEELSHQMEYYASEARTDVLTGLANRRVLEEEMVRLLADFRDANRPYSLVMVDIDRFKKFNDVHGHLAGDEVLRGVALILRENTRGQDVVTRFGGEEFAILLPGTSARDACRGSEAIRQAIEKASFHVNGKALTVTVSLGTAEMLPFETNTSLMKRADQSLYAAKEAGRNRSFWHDGTGIQPVLPDTLDSPWRPQRGGANEHTDPHLEYSTPSTEGPATHSDQESGRTPAVVLTESPANVNPANANGGKPRDTFRMEKAIERQLEVGASPGKIDREILQNLGNKTMFCQDIRRQIAQWDRGGPPFSMILLSIDNHDELTRRHGASNAKLFWQAVAEVLRHGVRDMDLIARYSDQTFGLVLPDCGLKNAIRLGERLRKEICGSPVLVNGQSVNCTVSLGIVEVAEGDEMATLVERARARLLQAAGNGGNRSVFAALAHTH